MSLIALVPHVSPDAHFLILRIVPVIRKGPHIFQQVCKADPGPGHHGTEGEQMKR
jgi:hypothetical protein